MQTKRKSAPSVGLERRGEGGSRDAWRWSQRMSQRIARGWGRVPGDCIQALRAFRRARLITNNIKMDSKMNNFMLFEKPRT